MMSGEEEVGEIGLRKMVKVRCGRSLRQPRFTVALRQISLFGDDN